MHPSLVLAVLVLAVVSVSAVSTPVRAQQNLEPPTQQVPQKPPSMNGEVLEKQDQDGNGPEASGAADQASRKRPARPPSPLDLLMKDGIPDHAAKRAVLRDDLYALLATAANVKEAKKIAAQIQRVWRANASDTVSVLMRRAGSALKAKDKKLALTLLDSIVELAPDHAEAWNRRAFVHYSTKNYRAAVGDLRRALALDKNHFKALDGLATIFQQMGDDAKALRVYEQLRQVHPHFPQLDKSYENLKRKVEGRGI